MSVAANDEEGGDPETPTASITYTASEDGKTLTISGKGDVTSLTTTDYSAKVFSAKAVGQVYTDQYGNGNSFVSITEGASYSVANKYYLPEYTQLFDGGAPTNGDYVYSVTTAEDGTVTYTCGYNKKVFVSSDNGATKTALTGGQIYTYTSGQTFYTASTFKQIEDNATYFSEHSDYLTADPTEITVVDLTRRKIYNASYTTVKFVSEDSSSPLIIDNAIVKAVLFNATKAGDYYSYAKNSTLESLDLSGAICKSLSQTTFKFDLGQYADGTLKITDITLPLAEKDENGDVTVPYMIVEELKSTLKTITVPDGYTKIGKNAFDYLKDITTFNLCNGITEIGDYAFRQTAIAEWDLPTSLKRIGVEAFSNCTSITSVTFPESLETIDKAAFANCSSYHSIKLNQGLKIIANSAFYLQTNDYKDQKVLEIPSSVKYIGPGAFNSRLYMDVYYYGETAPLSPIGKVYSAQDVTMSAFGSKMLTGNNGFNKSKYDTVTDEDGNQKQVETTRGDASKGYANRENYINGGNSYYFAVLHFRSDIKDDQAETFTDITRKYETYKGTGNFPVEGSDDSKYTVGSETDVPTYAGFGPGQAKFVTYGYKDTSLGSQYIWPSQMQFARSWAVNSNGYKWDGVTQYLPELDANDITLIRNQEGWESTGESAVSDNEIRKLAYMGTRQFVLISRDLDSGDDPSHEDVDITGERWWSLCLPVDVTRDEVDRVFGANTRLCLFSKVVRQVDETNGNEIHLYFQNDTYKNKYTRAADGTWTKGEAVANGSDVVLYAHTPYMIYPAKRKDDGSKYVLENFTKKEGDVLVTVVKSVASADATSTDENSVNYTFAGNYRESIATVVPGTDEGSYSVVFMPVYFPQYSYVFGRRNASETESKFWFYTGLKGTWKPNKCLVEREDDTKNEDEYTNFFKQIATSAKQYSIFGDDEETTAIDKVIYHYGDDDAVAPIYNISGQLVSTNGSAAGLAKGIYIQNGKKFIVK